MEGKYHAVEYRSGLTLVEKRPNSSKSSATEAAYKFNRPRGTRTTTDCHPSDRQSGSFFDGTTMEHIVTNNSDVSTEMENTLGDVDAIVDAGQLYFSHRSNPSFNKPTIIQPVVDHISGVLENIRADILFIDRCEVIEGLPLFLNPCSLFSYSPKILRHTLTNFVLVLLKHGGRYNCAFRVRPNSSICGVVSEIIKSISFVAGECHMLTCIWSTDLFMRSDFPLGQTELQRI
jgi:hypothetical protein